MAGGMAGPMGGSAAASPSPSPPLLRGGPTEAERPMDAASEDEGQGETDAASKPAPPVPRIAPSRAVSRATRTGSMAESAGAARRRQDNTDQQDETGATESAAVKMRRAGEPRGVSATWRVGETRRARLVIVPTRGAARARVLLDVTSALRVVGTKWHRVDY